MNRTPVRSSNLKSVGYNSASQILEIEFKDGGVYQYSSVPSNIHQGLMTAASHGKYFHAFIKGKYSYTKIN